MLTRKFLDNGTGFAKKISTIFNKEQMYEASLINGDEEATSSGPQVFEIDLLKEDDGRFGFSIRGGIGDELLLHDNGIYVTKIEEDGLAAMDGRLFVGDKLIGIRTIKGEISFKNVKNAVAVEALRSSSGVVTLLGHYRNEEFNLFEGCAQVRRRRAASIEVDDRLSLPKRSQYVRTLFDFEPKPNDCLPTRGLPFVCGEILHLINASDDEWWKAARVLSDKDEDIGIVPSKQRFERKIKAMNRTVRFQNVSSERKTIIQKIKNFKFSRKFPFFKNSDGEKNTDGNESPTLNVIKNEVASTEPILICCSKNDDEEVGEQAVFQPYEVVCRETIKYVRPVIILGELKDRINDDLLAECPEQFCACVPHTTRAKRDDEVDGRDFHFVASREQMESDLKNNVFIEAWQYKDNLFGTSLAAVQAVVEMGKHCILDVTGNAIKNLQAAQLYPIVIFIRPKSLDSVMEMNRRMTEEQAVSTYNYAINMEQKFGKYFTGVVQGDTMDEIYTKAKSVISQSGSIVWVTSKEPL